MMVCLKKYFCQFCARHLLFLEFKNLINIFPTPCLPVIIIIHCSMFTMECLQYATYLHYAVSWRIQFSFNYRFYILHFLLYNEINSFIKNRKFYAKLNFLRKLTKIKILSTELNNWRFIQLLHTTKLLTKKYA